MLSFCREKAAHEGLKPHLYQQALHDLDLPRTYQTIVACGSLGIGVSRQEDLLALQRLFHHLNPGGVLLLDNHHPYTDAHVWSLWQNKAARHQLPEPWPATLGLTPPEDSDYALYSRIVAFDPLQQRVTRQMRALLWRDGQRVAEEEYTLSENHYFCNELRQMLEQVGFAIEAAQGDYTAAEVTADHDAIVFIARKQV
jgi:hypothetical protein